jgi:hypothetical protein
MVFHWTVHPSCLCAVQTPDQGGWTSTMFIYLSSTNQDRTGQMYTHSVGLSVTHVARQLRLLTTCHATMGVMQWKGGAPDWVVPVPRVRGPADGLTSIVQIGQVDVQDVRALCKWQAGFSKAYVCCLRVREANSRLSKGRRATRY